MVMKKMKKTKNMNIMNEKDENYEKDDEIYEKDDEDEPVSSTTPLTSLSSRFEALKIIVEYLKSDNYN